MNFIEIIQNKVKKRSTISARSVIFSSFINFLFGDLGLLDLDLNFSSGSLSCFEILNERRVAQEISGSGGQASQEIIF